MHQFIDERTVMQFYLEQIDQDNVVFLKDNDEQKAEIRKLIVKMLEAEKMNTRIQIACDLWKLLFEASMSYISPDKRGYDKIFKYFDAYVEFEELIFASDSFYRDHTLHCLWVFFLGEYLYRKEEFQDLFADMNNMMVVIDAMEEVLLKMNMVDDASLKSFKSSANLVKGIKKNNEAVRCVAALTHDLGYPLKKIEKINNSIKKVLPYFSIQHFDDFTFQYADVQGEFIKNFIDFISRNFSLNLNGSAQAGEIMGKIVTTNAYGNAVGINQDVIDKLTEDEMKVLAESCKFETYYYAPIAYKLGFAKDFEEYAHGILSSFLLCKNLNAFQRIDYDMIRNELGSYSNNYSPLTILTLQGILSSVANHTSSTYQIGTLDEDSFLTFVDELEEFSRISRASQNREYVEEFCDTKLYMEDGWLNVYFEFNNNELDNLNPEISFKGRCKRFLSLFDIRNMSPNLKIRVIIQGKLESNQNTYVLEIAHKHADIIINGESVNIPSYLKSQQYSTKEEYAR